MKKYGLIGYPLSHSFSPKFFAKKFDREGIIANYKAYPIADVALFLALMDNNLSGLNVTIPYKESVMPYLDKLSDAAAAIGAVNTIKLEHGQLVGYNTDVYGFEQSLIQHPAFPGVTAGKALILGTGGAAKAVHYVLNKLGFDTAFVSRSKGDFTYQELNQTLIESHLLIVNTTPLGMSPLVDACPDIPYSFMGSKHLAYDLVYNPDKSLFLAKAEAAGAAIKNGAEMLVLQAERSWEIWNA